MYVQKERISIMTKEFLVKFDAKLIIDGQIQVKANSEEDAEKLSEIILQETLNCEDCIIELENNCLPFFHYGKVIHIF